MQALWFNIHSTKAWEKHVIFKPWDIAQKLLGNEMFGANSKKTLNDKMELYFNDHEFSYLMIQENYLKQRPDRAGSYGGKEANLKALELADNAAMSISDGDLADAMIHGPQQHWSLMPVHGMLSTVIPASNMYGSYGGQQMSFTSWLGNNSKMGRYSTFWVEGYPLTFTRQTQSICQRDTKPHPATCVWRSPRDSAVVHPQLFQPACAPSRGRRQGCRSGHHSGHG
jgi:hypothetical protein